MCRRRVGFDSDWTGVILAVNPLHRRSGAAPYHIGHLLHNQYPLWVPQHEDRRRV